MQVWTLDKLSPEPHHPQVLRSDDGATRTIALTLPRGELLQEHQVHEHAWLVVLEGELEVSSGDEQQRLGAGSLAFFDAAERHEVRAVSDARLLLLLSPWPGPGHPNLHVA
jgi:quercetin dioxygenase-like cupin family protein